MILNVLNKVFKINLSLTNSEFKQIHLGVLNDNLVNHTLHITHAL